MSIDPDNRQSGVVLVFSLLVLLMLGLLLGTLLRTSAMQLRVAGSLEISARERQLALAEIERVLVLLGADLPPGGPGYRLCTPGNPEPACNGYTLAPDPSSSAMAYTEVLREGAPPPRMVQDWASSGLAYRSLRYEVGASVGHSSLIQGVLVNYPERSP